MKPLVLIVEDDPALGVTLRELLEEHGYRAHLSRDGEEALEALGHLPIPGLVVLDLVLPRFDGWNLLKVLNGLSALPILVTSALPEKDRALARGATLLPKPFSEDQFLQLVSALCPIRPAPAPMELPPPTTAPVR